MKVSPGLVGRVVSVQLARPLYMIDYAAHLKYQDGRAFLTGEPMIFQSDKGNVPVAMDLLLSAEVMEVTDDSITVALVTPTQSVVHHTIRSSDIVDIAEVKEFECKELPTPTLMKRMPSPGGGKLILP